ncbi:4-hydroxy-tetrahydrodipicolinate reductase [Candidatus Marinamargulisbacteria bacterium SCGC AG-333-B06]|nr:4-hydroxy-tetrahydrodipicolinate reductase [Candidatus Marinamargulisbacteria bacterium SCGC AG-333-B06]
MINVLINGANGKMGQAAVQAVSADDTLSLVASLDKEDSLEQTLSNHSVDVVVDLTHPSCVYDHVKTILNASCHAVVGTTGLTDAQLHECGELASRKNKSLLVCPNFAIGAILLMRFSQQAAKFMDRCEIIEYHHDKKADSPSGTAIKTADLIAESHSSINQPSLKDTELIQGSRGGQKHNIPIHSIRVPGLVANQDVIFGANGETLTLKHETISRDAFMPGLLIAIKATSSHTGLTYGLENLLD